MTTFEYLKWKETGSTKSKSKIIKEKLTLKEEDIRKEKELYEGDLTDENEAD
jgi:hypothetical protein